MALLITGACGDSDSDSDSDSGGSAASSALGPRNEAKGTPIKIGFISDGKSANLDTSVESKVGPATAEYLNTYRNGIAGHPIELDTCITQADPGKGQVCANQMVTNGVAAVVVGSIASIETVWTTLHAAKVPLLVYGSSIPQLAADADSTFLMVSSLPSYVDVPMQLARDNKLKKVSFVTIDVPQATAFGKTAGPQIYRAAGMELDLVAIPAGTADMTAQMGQLVRGDPGVVQITGNDAFCIAALNGLRAANFTGPITALSQCFTDATRKAVPGDFLKGIATPATFPAGDPDSPGFELYEAILAAYAKDVPPLSATPWGIHTTIMGLWTATKGITGDITPAAIIAKMRSMPDTTFDTLGGLHFRCNGKASPQQPALCSKGGLLTHLDDKGEPTTYEKVGDSPIPG